MADEAAPVAAPEAAVEAPAVTPEPEATPESPLKKESFREAFERHQRKVEAEGKTDPEPAKPKVEPAKPNGKKVVTANPELEQLSQLAKKLGFTLESDKILPSDRAKFRNWEKERTSRLEQTEKERLAAVEAREKAVETEVKRAQTILKNAANGDYQGLAKELGFENWDKLQEDVIARIADPNYKRLRELEERAAREEEEKAKAKEESERTAKQQKQAEMRQAVYKKFATEMPQSKDPLVAAMGDHPLFVGAALRIQEENWDGSALPYERIAGMAAKGANKTLREECKELYDRLHKAFGGQSAPAAPVKRPVGKSAPVPPSRTIEPSGAKTMTRDERNAYERQRLAEAIDQDRKAGRL